MLSAERPVYITVKELPLVLIPRGRERLADFSLNLDTAGVTAIEARSLSYSPSQTMGRGLSESERDSQLAVANNTGCARQRNRGKLSKWFSSRSVGDEC